MGATTDTKTDKPKGESEFTAITTQEQFDQAVGDRVRREKAKFADYEDLKAKAAQFDVAATAQQTAEEANNARLAKVEKDLNDQRVDNLRLRAASKAGLPDGYHEFLTGTTEEILADQAERLLGLGKGALSQGGVVTDEGSTKVPDKTDPKRAFLAEINDQE